MLTLAIPSKGRLQEQTLEYFSDAGLKLQQSRGARDYHAKFSGVESVNIKLLSAGEIADDLIAGRIHLGVTGEDLIAERMAGRQVCNLQRLGFGKANVVVAVPRAWVDVSTMADLDDVAASYHTRHQRKMRVATKFLNLARQFFSSHGIADYRIIESLGATEGAPAAGSAELIVDITTTGATLTANELKVLDDGLILESQASLMASLRAVWSNANRSAAAELLDRLYARATAKSSQVLELRLKEPNPELKKALEPAAGVLSVWSQDPSGIGLVVEESEVAKIVQHVRQIAPDAVITTSKPDQIHLQPNPLNKRLTAALDEAAR